MDRTIRTARRARTRLLAGDLVARAGAWMLWGAYAGAGAVAVQKLIGLPWPWWVWVAAPVVVGGLGASVYELMRPRSLVASASLLDERLGLKDRLASALALDASPGRGDPFVRLAVADAEGVAAGADTRRGVPVRAGRTWWAWPSVVAASVAGALWLPASGLVEAREQRRVAAVRESVEKTHAADEIRAALKAASAPPPAPAPVDQRTAGADALAARRLESLEKLEEQLRTGNISADEARTESAKTLEQAASELDQRSEESRRAAEAARDRLAGLEPPRADAPESPLTRAVREGDLRAAREAARELMEHADTLSAEERAKIAEDMRRLSEELSAPASPERGASPESPATPASGANPSPEQQASTPEEERLQQEMREQGLSEQQARDIANTPSESEAKKKLEDLGLPPEAARKIAERTAEQARERTSREEARQKADDLARSMKDAAETLNPQQSPSGNDAERRPPQQKEGGNQQNEDSAQQRSGTQPRPGENGGKPDQQQRPGSEQGAQDRKSTAGERGNTGEQRPERNATSGTERRQGSPGTDPNSTQEGAIQGSKEGAREGTQQGEKNAGSQGSKENPKPGEQGTPRDAGSERSQQPGTPKEGGEPTGAGQESQGAQRDGSQEQQGAKPEQQPGGAPKGDGQAPKGEPNLDNLPSPDSVQGKALKKVIEKLRDMESSKEDAARDRRSAQEMRERAKRMLENASPEQRRKLEQWAKELAKEQRDSGDQQGPPQARGQGEQDQRRGGGEGHPERTDGSVAQNEPGVPTEGSGTAAGNEARRAGARDGTEPAPGTFRTDTVDARPREGGTPNDGRIAGEVTGNSKPGAPMLSQAEAVDAARRARDAAQRAIDDRTIPGRYDRLLRRYFKRLPEKLDEKAPLK